MAYLAPWASEDLVLIDLNFMRITSAQLISIFTIVLLTFINTRGVQGGKIIQTFLTVVKLVSLLG